MSNTLLTLDLPPTKKLFYASSEVVDHLRLGISIDMKIECFNKKNSRFVSIISQLIYPSLSIIYVSRLLSSALW